MNARPSPALLALGFVDRRIVTAALRSARGHLPEAASILGVSTLELMMLLADEPELMNGSGRGGSGTSGVRQRSVEVGDPGHDPDDTGDQGSTPP